MRKKAELVYVHMMRAGPVASTHRRSAQNRAQRVEVLAGALQECFELAWEAGFVEARGEDR